MADQNTISELWAIASGVGPVDVRLFVLLGEPRHISVSNDQPKLLITDIPIIGVTIQNLGSIAIEIGGSRALQYGQGVRVPPNSQWTPGGVSPIGASGIDTSVARPLYYDRNPNQATQNFAAVGVVPHASTTRWSYTVPATRKAFLQRVMALILRDAVAAPAGRVQINVRYLPANGSPPITLGYASIITNNLGDNSRDSFSGVGELSPGDYMDSITSDVSTGGSTFMDAAMWVVEFDA